MVEPTSTKSPSPYDSENPRFRKAYIRERLAVLKAERDALVAERAAIEEEILREKMPSPALKSVA